jgi:hypothetical protein
VLDALHEHFVVTQVAEGQLLLRPRARGERTMVLVSGAAVLGEWDTSVSGDFAAAVRAASRRARGRERYLVISDGRVHPSTMAELPPVRDESADGSDQEPPDGHWLPYS